MRICFALTLFSLLWATHHCAPKRMFMLSFPRTGVRSHLTHLTYPERSPESAISSEPVVRSRKRNIAALAHDNLIPATKRFDEEMIFDGDLIFPLISKRDYGEELGSDIIYEDARDKNDRKDYKRDEEAMKKTQD
ncbi:uncharacterized protein LOC111266752 isoform X2 [Varroa jacobsoni]|uniref:Uncharacterized protein n=1 Tax=Varroa destructor TaxID=109461 RepID=A0A7M7KVJ5_VARDE|nr:uncharacterized protein LOC111254579 isoform X2 [Varroa destructor]XP_022700225.1 uncharacterized protein LOC111266752 isoform X2 [Varroa jacobsoni]